MLSNSFARGEARRCQVARSMRRILMTPGKFCFSASRYLLDNHVADARWLRLVGAPQKRGRDFADPPFARDQV
jgi:hypothetical protein